LIYSRLKLVNKRLATTKYVDIVSNKTVEQDFKDYVKDNIIFYGKDESINLDFLIDGYGGLFFTPAKGEELYRTVVYGMEVHAFYTKDANQILKEKSPELFSKPEQNYARRREFDEIQTKLTKLPPKITVEYLATYNNIGTKEKVKLDEPILTHKFFNNIAPGEILPINPETAGNLEKFIYNGIKMVFLSKLNTIDVIELALNSKGYIL
jgi:hypothetical protein